MLSHGTASDKILDSYQSERMPIGEALQHDTLAQFALFSAFDPPALALRRMLSGFLRVPEVNRQLSDQLSGFGVAYPEPLFQADQDWEHWKGVSGHRLSDRDLVLKDGSRTTLYQCLEGGHWVRLQVAAESTPTPVMGAINVVNLAPPTPTMACSANSPQCLSVRMATSPMCAPRPVSAAHSNASRRCGVG